eukprot:TRINITY_DN1473_c0_g1_i2.p1 TRINITY_DN1473_c0_g1~~TRINITY_DN1473_c0_g1_i2.p1  ORF type:complete len:318 (+),score=52.44 TRINITY_DN1473_c0_g1_i2:61-1014(+)
MNYLRSLITNVFLPITFTSATLTTSKESIGFNIYGYIITPVYRNDLGLPSITPPDPFPQTIDVFFSLESNVSRAVDPKLTDKNFTFTISTTMPRPLQWEILIGNNEFFRRVWIDSNREHPCYDDEHHRGLSKQIRGESYGTSFLLWCIVTSSIYHPSTKSSFVLSLLPVDPHWILRSNIVEKFYFKNPDVVIDAVAFCDFALCIPSFDVHLEKRKGKEVTTSYVTTTLASNNLLPDDIVNYPLSIRSILVFYSTESIQSSPPTLRANYLKEVDKYTVTDTAIDSFAISGIIVSCILLIVTLAKLILFFVFNPNGRHL